MKAPWDWEEEDIEALIRNGFQESLYLDYKRCAALDRRNPRSRADLSKDVSAFANSDGGTLVYGVAENNHLPEAIDEGYDPADITREWVEQVINSTIQQRIDGIRIKQIELKKVRPGRVIYVVSIPQSQRAPHMASDHIFYKRFNFESVPMEEYEIRDIANRATTPRASVEFGFLQISTLADSLGYQLKVTVCNHGNRLINHFKLEFSFPHFAGYPGQQLVHHRPNIWINLNANNDFIVAYNSTAVLFPQEQRPIGDEIIWVYALGNNDILKLQDAEGAGEPVTLKWTLYADNMVPLTDTHPLNALHRYSR